MAGPETSNNVSLDAPQIRAMLEHAEPNVLRLALYQITGDPDLAKMRVEKQPVRGGILIADVLAPEDWEALREKAVNFLLNPPAKLPALPSDDELRRLLALFSNDPLDDNLFQFAKEEIAFEDFPRKVDWSRKPRAESLEKLHVTVVGCGISGIAAGVQLKRLGIPFSILERNSDVGGTWWTNNYPNCRVDTTSYLYQFKFEKNYPWSEHFATAKETLNYLKYLVDKHDLRKHVKFSTEVTSAQWDEETAKWQITARGLDGKEEVSASNFVLSAVGIFHTPKLPNIKGIDSYKGAMFHTTRWDHTFAHAGKRVGIIGNGSTGSQLMPKIAQTAASLTVFQRTPQWVMPAENYGAPIHAAVRWLFDHMPHYWNWFCYFQFISAMKLQGIMVYDPEWKRQGGKINERNDTLRKNLLRYIEQKVGSKPALHAKLVPRYAPFGRRSVIDSGWYDALMRDNVRLETTEIDSFTSDGVRTTDGIEHPLDLVVLATGFRVSRFLWPVDYIGRNGVTLSDVWKKDGARSYLGMAMSGFPNFFMFWGPNGGARNGGYYSWAEIWSRYILKAIVHLVENGEKSIEVKKEVFEQYNRDVDEEMKKLLWGEEAVGSYYQNEFGRMDIAAPWVVEDFHAMLREPKIEDFEIR